MEIERISSVRQIEPIFDSPYRPTYSLPPSPSQPQLLSKLEIAHPTSKPIVCSLATFLERLSSIEGIYLEMLEREMDQAHETISSQMQEHLKHQKEIEKSAEANDYWDTLRKVAVCFFGAASIVVGITLLGPEATALSALAGASMIISGGATLLGNTLFEMRENPKAGTALMIVGGAFGVMGSISSAIMGIGPLTEILGRVVVASLSVAANSAEAMKASYKWKLADMKASYTTVQKASEVSRERYRTMQKDLENFGENLSRSTDICISAQNHYLAAIKKITALSGPLGAA